MESTIKVAPSSPGTVPILHRLRSLLLRPESAAAAASLLILIGFSIASPLFLAKETFISVTNLVAELGIVSVGVTFSL